MNQNLSEAKIFHSALTQIPRALYNEKALFALLLTGLLSVSLVFLGFYLGAAIATLFIFLTLLVVLPAGSSVAGLLLMDQARGQTPRPLRKAVFDSIPAFLRTLGIMLIGVLLMVVFYLFICLLLFVCKLPAIGPALYAVLFPIMVIMAGLLYFGLMAGLSMACPAVWSGASIREALETLWQITTTRTVELLLNLLLLAILFVLVEFILLSIFFVGSQIVQGASASILGTSAFSLAPNPVNFLAALSSSDYALATIFGFMTGLMLFMTALTAMAMMGINLIYLQITNDLPPRKARESALNPMSRNASSGKEPAIQSAPQAGSHPGSGTPDILSSLLAETKPASTAATGTICPRCRVAAQPGDCFCGECGSSLKN